MAQFLSSITLLQLKVLFVPRNIRPASEFNPRKAFLGSIPSGYIDQDQLYLFDLVNRCVYKISKKDMGDLKKKYADGKSFRVARINFALERFLRCPGEKELDPEVDRRCARKFEASIF